MQKYPSLSLKEISRLTGQSANTVAVQVHRGVAKLRVLYNTPETTLLLPLTSALTKKIRN